MADRPIQVLLGAILVMALLFPDVAGRHAAILAKAFHAEMARAGSQGLVIKLPPGREEAGAP